MINGYKIAGILLIVVGFLIGIWGINRSLWGQAHVLGIVVGMPFLAIGYAFALYGFGVDRRKERA
jgi:polyferredoxin